MVDVRHGRPPRGAPPVILAPSVAPLLATIEETYTRGGGPRAAPLRREHNLLRALALALRARRVEGAEAPSPAPIRVAALLPTGGDDPEGNSAAARDAFFVACDRRVGPRDHPDGYEARAVDLAVEADRRWALRAHLVVVGDEWADAHHERDAALAAALAAARARVAVVVALGASACRALALGRVGLVPFRVAVVDPGDGDGDGDGKHEAASPPPPSSPSLGTIVNAPAVRALARACAADGVPGLAVPAAAAALCFADGTAEALVLDAVRFDPIDETSHANANVPARARLLRETLRATATLFAGAVAESVAVAASSSSNLAAAAAGGNRTDHLGDWPVWTGGARVAADKIERAAKLLSHPDVDSLVVFTGAGMSAESGMPAFRDTVPGQVRVDEDGAPCERTALDALAPLWERYDPEKYSTLAAYREEPDRCWALHREMMAQARGLRPNAGHLAVAKLAREGAKLRPPLRVTVVTQNVDGMHRRAGDVDALELHGSAERVACSNACGWSAPADAFLRELDEKEKEGANENRDPKRRRRDDDGDGTDDTLLERAPTCGGCGVRPAKFDCVLFGEALPEGATRAAMAACASARSMLVVGTSLSVYPAAELPRVCRLHAGGDAPVVEINATRAETPAEADIVVAAKAAETLPALVDRILELRKESAGDAPPAGGGGGEGGRPQMFARPRMF